MEFHKNGTYGAMIHQRNDGGGFDVYFLYNVSGEYSGDVWDRKCYKRETTAFKKINQFFVERGCKVA